MDITTIIIAVFCLIDDFMTGRRLRRRGPQPTLRDSEVLTMEVVGEFLGMDTESYSSARSLWNGGNVATRSSLRAIMGLIVMGITVEPHSSNMKCLW
jgi:hypothetical protein